MEDNYMPYGPAWEKEMMKLPKKFLIEMIKKAQLQLHLAEKLIDESSCVPDVVERNPAAGDYSGI